MAPAEIRMHLPSAVWDWLSGGAVLLAFASLLLVCFGVFGIGRRSRRGGYRAGPGLSSVLLTALTRQADTIVMLCAGAAFVILVALNARGGR